MFILPNGLIWPIPRTKDELEPLVGHWVSRDSVWHPYEIVAVSEKDVTLRSLMDEGAEPITIAIQYFRMKYTYEGKEY